MEYEYELAKWKCKTCEMNFTSLAELLTPPRCLHFDWQRGWAAKHNSRPLGTRVAPEEMVVVDHFSSSDLNEIGRWSNG